MDNKPCCDNCLFYHATPLETKNQGQCRERPPTVFCVMSQQGPGFITAWPTVREENWCGSYEPRGEMEEMQQ